MLNTVLANLKNLQNGWSKSSQDLNKQLQELQKELQNEKQKRESLETSINELNKTVSSLIDYLKAESTGQQ